MGVIVNGFVAIARGAVVLGALVWTGQASAQFGPPGFGPPGGGDFRGYRDSDRDRDRDRDRQSSSGYSSGSRTGSSGSSSSQGSAVTTPSQVRVTVSLQASYSDVDTDRDGQVGLYEWKKARRPLSQFTQMDINRDGFLTPRELERAASMPAVASTTTSSSSATATGAPTASSPVASSATTTTPKPAYVSNLSEEDQTKADEAQAKSVFSLLDKNHDGKISAEEMASSSRMRPLFEQAGVSFTEPMPAEQFVSNYVRIRKSQRT